MVVGSLDIQTDVLIIGAGPGGYVAAIRAAQLGKEVMVVEDSSKLGGVCLNTGCIPTKAVIHASNFHQTIKDMAWAGITVKDYTVDLSKMHAWKQEIVDKLGNGIKSLFKNYGIEVVPGRAVFKNDHEVHIEGKTDITSIKFKNCIIATGSSIIEIQGFRFDGKYIIGSDEALELRDIPKKMIIIGGGYIGTEMGTVYAKLGTEVSIVEFTDRLISVLEPDVVDVVSRKLDEFNVKKYLKSKALNCEIRDNKVYVKIEHDGKEEILDADKVLVVVGRKPNSNNIGLENTGIKIDSKGFISVDKQMRTSVSHIFAIGDVVGQPMLAHKASREAKVAAEVISGLPSAFDNKVIPFVVFNDPEIASVGLREDEAKAKGIKYIVGKFPFSASGRAMTLNQTEGFVKYIAEESTGIILGVHAVGPSASDIISEATLGIEMGATLEDIALTIHPHPTLPETMMEAAEVTLGQGIHIFNPKFKK
jgi:dihydrolipoamide dehydrogenase